MDNPQKKSGAQQAPPAAPESRSGDTSDLRKQFEQAYHDYLSALKDTQTDAQKRCLQAQREYTSALQNSSVEIQKRLNEINQTYASQVQDAWGDPNAQKLVTEAYRNYTKTLREASEDAQKRWQDANEKLTAPAHDLNEDTKKKCERAYQNYVSAIKNAWAAADPTAIDPNTFAVISNSLAAASWYAVNLAGRNSAE